MIDLDVQRQIRDLQDRLERLEKSDIGPVFGTYTPTYDGATPGATTYTTQAGFYCRIGKMIIAWGTLVWTAASGTGTAQISLPFTASATANNNAPAFVRTVNVTFANGSVQAQVVATAAVMTMLSPATNAAGTVLTVEAAGNIIFMAIYPID